MITESYFNNPVAWYNILLCILMLIQIISVNEFNGSYSTFKGALSLFAFVWMILCLIRIIMLSIRVEWWYGLYILFVSSAACGFIFPIIGRAGRLCVSVISFIAIPLIWYFGRTF